MQFCIYIYLLKLVLIFLFFLIFNLNFLLDDVLIFADCFKFEMLYNFKALLFVEDLNKFCPKYFML